MSSGIWTQPIKNFTLRGIPVRDDESGPDSSSRTGIPLGVKLFIRRVQIQLDIILSAPSLKEWADELGLAILKSTITLFTL